MASHLRWQMRRLRFFLAVVISASVLAGCDNGTSGGGAAYLTVQPVFSPVSFTIKTNGDIGVNAEAGIVTPLGRIAVGVEYSITNDPEAITVVIIHQPTQSRQLYKIATKGEFAASYSGSGSISINGRVITVDAVSGTFEVKSPMASQVANARSSPPSPPERFPLGSTQSLTWVNKTGHNFVVIQNGKEVVYRPGQTVPLTGVVVMHDGRKELKVQTGWCFGSPSYHGFGPLP